MYDVRTPEYLIVAIDTNILDLVYILNLPTCAINPHHDHLYLSTDDEDNLDSIFSYGSKTASDVQVSVETFSQILIDIASGMKVRQAFKRQGYYY